MHQHIRRFEQKAVFFFEDFQLYKLLHFIWNNGVFQTVPAITMEQAAVFLDYEIS